MQVHVGMFAFAYIKQPGQATHLVDPVLRFLRLRRASDTRARPDSTVCRKGEEASERGEEEEELLLLLLGM